VELRKGSSHLGIIQLWDTHQATSSSVFVVLLATISCSAQVQAVSILPAALPQAGRPAALKHNAPCWRSSWLTAWQLWRLPPLCRAANNRLAKHVTRHLGHYGHDRELMCSIYAWGLGLLSCGSHVQLQALPHVGQHVAELLPINVKRLAKLHYGLRVLLWREQPRRTPCACRRGALVHHHIAHPTACQA